MWHAKKYVFIEVRPLLEVIWVFPKIWIPQNGWFLMENPIKKMDLGVPLFLETPPLNIFKSYLSVSNPFNMRIYIQTKKNTISQRIQVSCSKSFNMISFPPLQKSLSSNPLSTENQDILVRIYCIYICIHT